METPRDAEIEEDIPEDYGSDFDTFTEDSVAKIEESKDSHLETQTPE